MDVDVAELAGGDSEELVAGGFCGSGLEGGDLGLRGGVGGYLECGGAGEDVGGGWGGGAEGEGVCVMVMMDVMISRCGRGCLNVGIGTPGMPAPKQSPGGLGSV